VSSTYSITPKSKIAELLEHYPELEDVLIAMAPPFKKLRNPVLRRTVAKVASLKQASAVGRIPIDEMVNRLRAAVGQDPVETASESDDESYYTTQPEWFDEARVVASIAESEIDPDVMPLNPLISRATRLAEGEIIELVTDFLPSPGIDLMRSKGFLSWSTEEGHVTRSYFTKPSAS